MAKVRTNFKKPAARHFIRAWRKFRGLTLEKLAERVGVTHGALSQLERGQVNYTQPMLEALAEALACQPGDLIMRDPTSEGAWSLLDSLTPETRRKAIDLLEMMQAADAAKKEDAA